MNFLIDHNLGGHAEILLGNIASQDWLNQVHVENRSSGPPFGKQATPPAPLPKGVREASSKKLPGAGI